MASASETMDMEKIVGQARAAFNAGKTRSKEARRKNLQSLLDLINENQDAMIQALKKDLNKPSLESMIGEVNLVKGEIVYFMNNLDKIINPKNVGDGSLMLMGKKAMVRNDPYGVCLVLGAWNYPIQLVLAPLAGAIAAGNAVVMKPSELSPASAEFFERVVPRYLDSDAFPVVTGGPEVGKAVLQQRFDHILYTGGSTVGKIILRAAAEHLTPVTLELGGKCPAYIDSSANIKSAARRIAWGKFQNAGQTCVAPDYVLCDANLKDKFLKEITEVLESFYGKDAKQSADYGRIINERHFDRINGLLQQSKDKVKYGGATDRSQKYIQPTILDNVTYDDPIMADEIFGPILPVVAVSGEDEAIRFINSREKPLALYVFSMDKKVNERFLAETSSGNISVNEVLVHCGVDVLPFGGVGNSGMGAYHGWFSVETFSHQKSCLIDPSPRISDMTSGVRYPPYSARAESLSLFLTRKATSGELRMLQILKYAIAIAVLAYGVKRFKIMEILASSGLITKRVQQHVMKALGFV